MELKYAFTWSAAKAEELQSGLERLTGYDYERAEREETKAGNASAMLTLTKSFQARLAAIALKVPVPEIKKLPLKQYNEVTTAVFGFLYNGSDETQKQAVSTDE